MEQLILQELTPVGSCKDKDTRMANNNMGHSNFIGPDQ
jgi:hypothetical protein